jgi:hypothetical protein
MQHAAFMQARVDDGFVLLGGPLADQRRVVLAVRAGSEDDVLRRLGDDPWSGTHLVVERVEEWTLRVNGCNADGSSGILAPDIGLHRALGHLASRCGLRPRSALLRRERPP